MKIGTSRILVCPFCGEEKEIMSLAMGNSLGAQLWSDNKLIARMLPEISYVQKCPCCGKYYITERQAAKYSKDNCSCETGYLTYEEMKAAFSQLSESGFVSKEEESVVRMMLHHAFNDYYFRSEDNKEIDADDWISFRKNCIWLIDNFISDRVMKAEFYREIGEFEKAQDVLVPAKEGSFVKRIVSLFKENFSKKRNRGFFLIQDRFLIKDNIVASLIQERISKKDSRVFRIK